MSEQDELQATIRAFADLDDAESVPLLTTLSIWRAELEARQGELAAQAILLAARFEALIAAQDTYFEQRLSFDQETARLDGERADYAESFSRLHGQMLGAAMRYRDREAYCEMTTTSATAVE